MRLLHSLAALAILAGCGRPEIRVANLSAVSFDRVLVTFPNQLEDFGAVAAGAASEYRAIGQAYPYARVEVMVGGESSVLQPIDYVGVTPLGPGKYTYALAYDRRGASEFERLRLELVKD